MRELYLTGFDLETTGLDYEKGDRIIEANFQTYRWRDRKKVFDRTWRFDPEGQKINARAQKVHGISATDLVGAPKFRELAPVIHRIMSSSAVIVTFNGERFDLPFLAFELVKCKLQPPGHLVSVDLMKRGMGASYDDKLPSLRELCWSMFVDYDDAKAHAADYDVAVMMDCYFKGVDRGLFASPESEVEEIAA